MTTDSPADAIRTSFRSNVSLVELSDQQVRLDSPWGHATLGRVTPGLLRALHALSGDGGTEAELLRCIGRDDGSTAASTLFYWLSRLGALRYLKYQVVARQGVLATVEPMVPGFEQRETPIGAAVRVRLSRFAFVRRDGDALLLESPLGLVRTVLFKRLAVVVLAELARPCSAQDLSIRLRDISETEARALLTLLASAGIVGEVDDDDAISEDEDPVLSGWEFHDLLFHVRSRTGRHDYPSGATFRFDGREPPLPAVRANFPGEGIPLYKPDLHRVAKSDLPFTEVVEGRRSIRVYGVDPITRRQLGEFLYRVARVRRLLEPDAGQGRRYQASDRPYPTGGACHELELYLAVASCRDLAAGMYHYDALDHRLFKVSDRNDAVVSLLRGAQAAASLMDEPQVLIIIASRFGRVAWKYSGLAYALTLKNVGVLLQTMYLVAAAMELAPCAVGSGNSEVFRAAVGGVPFAEPPVGEFLLGSAPRDREERHPRPS